ncbi:MAG: 16S rRNA (cytidine(1402)-2'-O)-methyltransferase [Chlamydiales bacterium]|nr:16S rRNA (cytidine(1402)-2'-O)-methyltransferase [Chlamydiales bacterium]
MLYLVATPIGNLKDFTFRAIETLQACDYILCEDTRTSSTLLNHYNIKKPLQSYHKFNEQQKCDKIIHDLQQGLNIALISDAGMPGIADPGYILVKQATENNLQVTSIPGASAIIAALACSGLPTERFQFAGFLPKKQEALKSTLQEYLSYQGVTLCFESPARLLETLELLETLAPTRLLVVARELTKRFEEIQRGTALDLVTHFQNAILKGEIVLLISPCLEKQKDWNSLTPIEHVTYMEETFQMSRKDAITVVAELRGVPKRIIYNEIVK